ncbi:MAG TPA: HAD-IIIA family hydrolase [Candidatus Binataceae bacterium]|nr:HAD-IIIA family hydrolase [Candidatus Binataceae bacterium]
MQGKITNLLDQGKAPERAVFLDRDGVLIRTLVREGKPVSVSTLAEVEILDGVAQACDRLKQAGFLLVVVTNQPDVSRGLMARETVEATNQLLSERLPVDELRTCYHDDRDDCDCRKPRPGMLLAAAAKWHIDLAASFMVGDRWRDIEAGQRAGCRTVFIDNGYEEAQPPRPDYRARSLAEAANWILRGAIER